MLQKILQSKIERQKYILNGCGGMRGVWVVQSFYVRWLVHQSFFYLFLVPSCDETYFLTTIHGYAASFVCWDPCKQTC